MTVRTAAGSTSTSSAWPDSESRGRASGSMMLTAVLEEQLKLEEESRVLAEDPESYPPTREENAVASIRFAEWTGRSGFWFAQRVRFLADGNWTQRD